MALLGLEVQLDILAIQVFIWICLQLLHCFENVILTFVFWLSHPSCAHKSITWNYFIPVSHFTGCDTGNKCDTEWCKSKAWQRTLKTHLWRVCVAQIPTRKIWKHFKQYQSTENNIRHKACTENTLKRYVYNLNLMKFMYCMWLPFQEVPH